MTTVLSSVSEISRVGGWALRGLGYPFGTAERGVRLLAWAEAVGCGATGGIRLSEGAIEASLTADPLAHRRDDRQGRCVSGNGRHLLEVGGAIVDLATTDARKEETGQVTADGIFGFALLPALANLLAHRKLSGVFVYSTARDDRLPDGLARIGWLCVKAGSTVAFSQGPLRDEADLDALVPALAGGSRLSADALRARVDDMLTGASGPTGRLGLLATAEMLPAGVHIPGQVTVDYRERFADALENGVPMKADDLDYLYALEMRTWAPTSERSRGQAGYGLY